MWLAFFIPPRPTRSRLGKALGCALLLIVLPVLLCLIGLELYWTFYLAHGEDDSATYLADLSTLLGSDWSTSEVYPYDDPYTDTAGFHRKVLGNACQHVWRRDAPSVFVRQCVFTYTDAAVAADRFATQRLRYDADAPPAVTPYEPIPWPDAASSLLADEYHFACVGTSAANQRCIALLRYGNHVAFVNAVLVRDGVRYLSEDDFWGIVRTVDRTVSAP